eukprot:scpid105884/ scgid23208/ 
MPTALCVPLWRPSHLGGISTSQTFLIPGAYDVAVFSSLEVRPVDEKLANPSSLEEVGRVIQSMAKGKAAGASGILPELVKYGSDELHGCLLGLILLVWSSGGVPHERWNAQLVPVPKRGDLSLCDKLPWDISFGGGGQDDRLLNTEQPSV